MKILKGVLKYGLILVALLIGAAFVMGAVMIFVPSVTIFGYRYANVTHTGSGFETNNYSDLNGFNKIEIDAGAYNVSISQNADPTLSIRSKLSVNGFFKYSEDKTAEELFLPTYNIQALKDNTADSTLRITVSQIEGLLNYTESTIAVKVPVNLMESGKIESINVKTASGTITIGSDDIIEVGEITLESYQGNQTIKNVRNIQYLNSTSNSGALLVEKTYAGATNEYSIKHDATIINQLGDIKLNTGINVEGKLKIETNMSTITLNDILGSFEYDGDSGLVNMKNVTGQLDISSNDAKFIIDKVQGSASNILATGEGNLTFEIGTIEAGSVSITSGSGAITINNLKSTQTVFTTKTGNVTINNAYLNATVTTRSGNISVTQPTLTGVEKDALVASEVKLETTSGSINANGIVSKLSVKVNNGRGIANITVVEVNDDITVEGSDGKITIILPVTDFDIVTESATGEVSIADMGIPTVTTKENTRSHIGHTAAEGEEKVTVTVITASGYIEIKSNIA